MAKLTAKQLRFCEEYLVDLNGTQAAIRAGYSARTAHVIAHENLGKPEIKTKIDEFKSQQSDRTQLNADLVLSKYLDIIGFQLSDVCIVDGKKLIYKPISEWNERALTAVSEIKTNSKNEIIGVETHSKVAALQALGKHLGMFSDFNVAMATFRRYGLKVVANESGGYSIEDEYRDSADN